MIERDEVKQKGSFVLWGVEEEERGEGGEEEEKEEGREGEEGREKPRGGGDRRERERDR